MPYIANPLEGIPLRHSFISDQSSLGEAPATTDQLVVYDISGNVLKKISIADLQTSSALTGTPTAPTANAGTDTTQIATTAFVNAAVALENQVSEMNDVTITSVASANVLIYDGSDSWDNKAISGDITLATSGAVAIASGVVVNADINASAAIDMSKTALVAGTGITLTTNTLNVDAAQTQITSVGALDAGSITSGFGTIDTGSSAITTTGAVAIASGVVVNADINASAAIDMYKTSLVSGTGITLTTNTLNVDAAQTQITSVGALDAGSITSGFGTIDTGSSAITTTGLISGGSLDIDDVLIGGTNIGHTDDTDLMTVANGLLTVAGEISVTTLDIGGTNVASTAAELNIMDGDTSASSTTLADADRVVVNDDGTMKQVALTDFETYFETSLDTLSSVTTVGALNAGSITSGFGAIDTGSSNITTTGTVSAGNLTVTGTTTTVNSTVLTVVDPIIHLQTASGGGDLSADTNKDVGLMMEYHNGSAAKQAFLGWDDSAAKLTFVPDATLSSEVVSGSVGTIVANLEGNATTATLAATVTVVDSTDTTSFVALFDSATGDLAVKTDAGLSYNSGTGMLTATGLTGPLTGTATGLSGSVLTGDVTTSGNAATLVLSNLTGAAVNVAADSIPFLDADGSATRIESIADFVSAIAGANLTASSGQLAASGGGVPNAFFFA